VRNILIHHAMQKGMYVCICIDLGDTHKLATEEYLFRYSKAILVLTCQ